MKQASALSKPVAVSEFAIPVALRLLDEMHEQIRAHIRRVNTGFFLIAAPMALKADRRVEMVFDDRRIELQVVYCHPQDNGIYHLGLRMTHGNHEALRAEPRIPVDLDAKLHLPGVELPVAGRVLNISASGFGLQLENEVPSGEIAYVELEIGFAFGEIRHCSQSGDGYRVGLKLDEFISRENEVLAVKRRSMGTSTPSGLAKFFGKWS